ncbi:hypothetical protein [Aeromicrobium sp. Sec7.5]|uniref:hypothetical protein n=1 Tax=Aeromicrobium sp. Sec7.5 TaxID=3121276 RepID=UPI002FE47086
MPDAEEPVGTLAEEAARLLAAVVSGGRSDVSEDDSVPGPDDSATSHRCTHGWCPLCQAADYVQEHPEVVTQVLVAGAELLKVVRDAVEKTAGRAHGHDEEQQ